MDTLTENHNLTNHTAHACEHLLPTTNWTGENDLFVTRWQYAYYVITTLTSILSVFGCILILYYYITIKSLQNKSRQLLIFLTFCDLGIAVGNIFGITLMVSSEDRYRDPTERVACYLQGGFCTAFSIASFFWTSFIGLNVYMTVNHNSKVLAERYTWLIHIMSWGVPLVVFAVSYSQNRFGFYHCEGYISMCWVQPHRGDYWWHIILWQLFAGKAWEITSYILVLTLYLSVKYNLKRFEKRTAANTQSCRTPYVQTSEYALADWKLTLIPLVFILTRIWGSLRFLLILGERNDDKDVSRVFEIIAVVLSPFEGFGDSAQGFLNCLVFVFTTPSIRSKFRKTDSELLVAGDRSPEESHTETNNARGSDTSSDSDSDGNVSIQGQADG